MGRVCEDPYGCVFNLTSIIRQEGLRYLYRIKESKFTFQLAFLYEILGCYAYCLFLALRSSSVCHRCENKQFQSCFVVDYVVKCPFMVKDAKPATSHKVLLSHCLFAYLASSSTISALDQINYSCTNIRTNSCILHAHIQKVSFYKLEKIY